MFAKPSAPDKRQSVLQRDILSGLADSIADARNTSTDQAPAASTTVMKAHLNQHLKGLGHLDRKLARGGVLSGLGPPLPVLHGIKSRRASPEPKKNKKNIEKPLGRQTLKSARRPDGKTLHEKLFTPLKESAPSKGKKAKKKKMARDAKGYPVDQDIDAAEEEEQKNAISEAAVDDEREQSEVTTEDHNLQLPSHGWPGGSGDAQQPGHGAHPSFSPGDAEAMLLIQDQRFSSEDKKDIDQDPHHGAGAQASGGYEHQYELQMMQQQEQDGEDIGHPAGSAHDAHASRASAAERQPNSFEDDANFGQLPDRLAAGSYRAESFDESKHQAEGSESQAHVEHAQDLDQVALKDLGQDIAAEPTGDQKEAEAIETDEHAVGQAPQRYLEEISQHDIARGQAAGAGDANQEEPKHDESEQSIGLDGAKEKPKSKKLTKYLTAEQKDKPDEGMLPVIPDPKHESMLADKEAPGDDQELKSDDSGGPHKAADEQMFALRDQISDTFKKLEAAQAQAHAATAPQRPESLLVASKQASARARQENAAGASKAGKVGAGQDGQVSSADLSAELGIGPRSYASQKSKQILAKKQPERLPMYSRQRIEQETQKFHQRRLENAQQKEAEERAAQLEEEKYMQEHARSQKKGKLDLVQFGLEYQKKLAQAEQRKKDREARVHEQRFGADGHTFQPRLVTSAANKIWVDPDRPKLEDRAHDELRKRRENVEALQLERAIQAQQARNATKELLQKSKQGPAQAAVSSFRGRDDSQQYYSREAWANTSGVVEPKSVVMSQFTKTQNKDAQLANMRPLRGKNQQEARFPGQQDGEDIQLNQKEFAAVERESLSDQPPDGGEDDDLERAVTPAAATAGLAGSDDGLEGQQARTKEPSQAQSSPSTTLMEDPKELVGAATGELGDRVAASQPGDGAYHSGLTQDTWQRQASNRIDQAQQDQVRQDLPQAAKRTPIQAPILAQQAQRAKQHPGVKSKFRQAAEARRPQVEDKKDYQKVINATLSSKKGTTTSQMAKPTISEALAGLHEVAAKQIHAKRMEFQKTQMANAIRKQVNQSEAKYRGANSGQTTTARAITGFEARMLEADNRDGLRDGRQRHVSSVESPRNAYAELKANPGAYYQDEDGGSSEQQISCVSQAENPEHSGDALGESGASPGLHLEQNDLVTNAAYKAARTQQTGLTGEDQQPYPQAMGQDAAHDAHVPFDHNQYDGSEQYAYHGGHEQEQPYGGEVRFEPAYDAYGPGAIPIEQQHSTESSEAHQVVHDAAGHMPMQGVSVAAQQAACHTALSLQPIHEEEEFVPDRQAGSQHPPPVPQAYYPTDEPLNLKLAPESQSLAYNHQDEDHQRMQQPEADTLALKVMHYNLIDDKTVAHSAIVQYIVDADPDVVGLSEVDVHPLYQDLKSSMSALGYLDHCVTGADQSSCSVIFYKQAKLLCTEAQQLELGPNSTQSPSEHYMTYLRLQSSQNACQQLIFGNVQLPDVSKRAQAAESIVRHFQSLHLEIPVLIGGDFDCQPAIPVITEQFVELGSLSNDEVAMQRRAIDSMYLLMNSWSQGLSNLSLCARDGAHHEPSAHANAYPVNLRFPASVAGTALHQDPNVYTSTEHQTHTDQQYFQHPLGEPGPQAVSTASQPPSEQA